MLISGAWKQSRSESSRHGQNEMTIEVQKQETQLDRIEALLRQLLEALIRMNQRLDVVCGRDVR